MFFISTIALPFSDCELNEDNELGLEFELKLLEELELKSDGAEVTANV